MNDLDKIIIDCFKSYKKSGQIIKESTIKKNYGENISNINIMMKFNNNIFLINCKHEYCDFNIVNKFNNDCDFIINKFKNRFINYHKIILSLKPINVFYYNIINIYVNPITDISISDYLLLKLYYYISKTTNYNFGLTYYNSDDVFMTYNPN